MHLGELTRNPQVLCEWRSGRGKWRPSSFPWIYLPTSTWRLVDIRNFHFYNKSSHIVAIHQPDNGWKVWLFGHDLPQVPSVRWRQSEVIKIHPNKWWFSCPKGYTKPLSGSAIHTVILRALMSSCHPPPSLNLVKSHPAKLTSTLTRQIPPAGFPRLLLEIQRPGPAHVQGSPARISCLKTNRFSN